MLGRAALVALASLALLSPARAGKAKQPLLSRQDENLMDAAAAAVRPASAVVSVSLPQVATTLQDMNDVMLTTKTRFTELVDRLSADSERLRQEFQQQQQVISDVQLEKASCQAQMEREKQKVNQELEAFKQKLIAKLTELQTANRRLEETNQQISATNDKLSQDLENEKAKKEALMQKLRKMASNFNNQQLAVRQIMEQQQKRVSDEVSSDMKDADATIGDLGQLPHLGAYLGPSGGLPTLDGLPSLDEALPMAGAAPAPMVATVAQALPVAPPAVRVAPVASPAPAVMPPPPQPHRAQAPQAVAAAAAPRAPPAARPAPAAVVAVQPRPVAPAVAAAAVPPPRANPSSVEAATAHALEDDEQLKMLHSEVAKLEMSVKNGDSGADSGDDASVSMDDFPASAASA